MSYLAFVLPESARETLKAQFEPKFTDFIGHHITLAFSNVVPEGFVVGNTAEVVVVGYAHDEGLEALVVTVNGKQMRPDGKVFHVTWSLDRDQGRKPVHSNDVIAAGKVIMLDHSIMFRAKLAIC